MSVKQQGFWNIDPETRLKLRLLALAKGKSLNRLLDEIVERIWKEDEHLVLEIQSSSGKTAKLVRDILNRLSKK